ncbi:MAG: hypothetical protein Q4C95_11350, partial [Planctomycetia bacterium]|nr:hypothetical protein [Planctomycetia bacterium]
MKNHLFKMLPVATLALTFLISCGLMTRAESDVQMDTYTLSDGTSCFLVPLQANSVQSTADYVDIAVLVDVSAAQMAKEVRQCGQQTVESLLENLPQNARVQLFTVDNETESLTGGFVAVDSQEMKDAIEALKDNTPLGASNLEKALETAANSFDLLENSDRSIVYVGRGISSASVFDVMTFNEIVENLVCDHISVHTFGNGTATNLEVLGALSNQTGGYVVDPAVKNGKVAGLLLAQATKATVFWPNEIVENIFSEETLLYPNPLPPIRSDRETYLIGKTTDDLKKFTISLSATQGNESKNLKWNVFPSKSNSRNQYLYQLVDSASKDNGKTLPIAGRILLNEMQAAIFDATENTLALTQTAIEVGDTENAKRLAELVEAKMPGEKFSMNLANQLNSQDDEQAITDQSTIIEPEVIEEPVAVEPEVIE